MPGTEEYKTIFGVSPEEDPALSAGGDPAPAGDGKQEQEPAAPAAETGGKEQGITEPAEGAKPDGGAQKPEEGEVEPMEPAGQTAEERHRMAQQRREREEAARRQAEQARIDQVYASIFTGQTDPFTGKPITTEAEFQAYQQAKQRKLQEEQLTAAGLQPNVIEQMVNQMVSQHPMVLQAQKAVEAAGAQQAQAVELQAQEAIGAEMKKITAADPSIKTLEDIAKMPTAPQFNAYVQRGLSLEESFYLANRQSIDTQRQAAAKQAAINQAKGKEHLNPVGDTGTGEVMVPPNVAQEYRAMMPGATDEQIQKEYAQYLKDIGKK